MKTKISLIAFLLVFNITNSIAQDIIGFWEIKKVEVGGKTMTPVAKWTKINKDGSYQSGNGWLQNSQGTWTYDKKRNLYLPTEANGLKDEFGPFTAEVKDNNMTWLRDEDGMIVTVNLERINEMPKSTADELIGLWDLLDIVKNQASILETYDPQNKHYMYMGWDRIYRERTPQGKRSTGYWHINGHRPELTLLSHDKNKAAESWKVVISTTELKMTGISDSNKGTEMIYQRIYEFPK